MDFQLSKTKTILLAADRKVKIIIKYVPTALPANINPIYDISGIYINKKYHKETLGGISVWNLSKIYDRNIRSQ